MIVTFFGHRTLFEDISDDLLRVLIELIEKEQATTFYVGNHGAFDSLVRRVLKKLSLVYPEISYAVVLAYMPLPSSQYTYEDFSDTIYPEEVAVSIPKFAISTRNRWMLRQSDVVVTYVKHTNGGAAAMKRSAIAKGKRVIELSSPRT